LKRIAVFLMFALPTLASGPALAAMDARLMRHPAVSSRQIAFVYAGDVWVAPKAGGMAQRLSTPSGEEAFPRFSPDGSRIAFTGNYGGNEDIYVVPAEGGLPKRMTHHPSSDRMLGWTPDGKAILYASAMASGDQPLMQIYKVAAGGGLPEKLPVPYGEFGAISPDGRYLYFGSIRTFRPSYGTDESWIFANASNLVAVPLRLDVASPLALRSDDEAVAGTMKADPGGTGSVEIDIAGFEGRAVILPPGEGRYLGLQALSGRLFYRRLPRTGSSETKSPLLVFDLRDREEKTVLEDVDTYQIATGREKILVAKRMEYSILDAKPNQKTDRRLATSELEATIDPMAEWRQIFSDVWRFQRDLFYDPNLHGVDWADMRKRYGALLDECVTRFDLSFVLGEMIAELNAFHTYRSGGDLEKSEQRDVGLLGADYALENGAYRIKTIYNGAPWDAEVRSPLLEPGLGVVEGDYLLAVNGIRIDTAKDPWAAFEGLAGKTVQLTINDKPTMVGARRVLVKTLASEGRLRTLAWGNANRLKVEAATGGRIGYIYVPDTGRQGKADLYRQFMGQLGKDGLIIDERFNTGGDIPDRFIDILARPVAYYWGVRDGMDWPWPWASVPGPKVMLINGWCGSGGDAFPYSFRKAGLGPLIGQRTYGGLIAAFGAPGLVDGGFVQVPTHGIYSTDGEWIIEGHGVDPDIRVVDDPSKMAGGGDPQLDKGIEEVMRLLKEKPWAAPRRPAYEDRSRK